MHLNGRQSIDQPIKHFPRCLFLRLLLTAHLSKLSNESEHQILSVCNILAFCKERNVFLSLHGISPPILTHTAVTAPSGSHQQQPPSDEIRDDALSVTWFLVSFPRLRSPKHPPIVSKIQRQTQPRLKF